MTDNTTGQLHFLAGTADALCTAVATFQADPSLAHYKVVLTIRRQLHKRVAEAVGQECPFCGGTGDRLVDELPTAWLSPSEYVYGTCRPCEGNGMILRDHLEAWAKAHPEEWEAVQDRYAEATP